MASPKTRSRTALLIMDAINPFDFDGAADIAPAAIAASKTIVDLRKAADAVKAPVIYVNDNYGHWDRKRNRSSSWRPRGPTPPPRLSAASSRADAITS